MPPLDTAGEREPDLYDWRTAPAHLMTRRQLRAAGLRPGGQQPVAWVPVEWRGRTQYAGLYDSRRAAPKRIATPAQLRAVAKAIREHQARAAERRGYSRAELSRATDPGPGWTDTPATTDQEEPMSDNEFEISHGAAHIEAVQLADELAAAQRDAEIDADDITGYESAEWVMVAQERLDAHLRDHREQLGGDPHWTSYYASLDRAESAPPETAGVPAGHGQRIAHVLAVTAVNQARYGLHQIRASQEAAQRPDSLLATRQLDQQRAFAETRLDRIAWANQWSLAGSLTDALMWHGASDLAATQLDSLRRVFAEQWGVLVDVDELTVSIDPAVDPEARQTYNEAAAVHARQTAILETLDTLPLDQAVKAAAADAIVRWRGEDLDHDPGAYLRDGEQRRAQLAADLDSAGVTGADRERIDFVVDYLTGGGRDIDLLASPVFVDPGQEARGRIPSLLLGFGDGQVSAEQMATEIAVMTPEDQARVREVGTAIRAGQDPDVQLWPGYVDRDQLGREIEALAADVEELAVTADYIADNDISSESPEMWGVDDELGENIARLASRGDRILAAAAGEGLADIERVQVASIVDDVDAGRIRARADLPELVFADERSKRAVDEKRLAATASEVAATVRGRVAEILGETSMATPNMVTLQTGILRDTIASVAFGATAHGVDHERRRYVGQRAKLDDELRRAGVEDEKRQAVRAAIDDTAHRAGVAGQVAADRHQRWGVKVERVAMVRDDHAAQQRAATAGRAKPPDAARGAGLQRACTARIDQSLNGVQSPAPAGIRQLHSMEVDR
ncbi:hypothetical protein BJY24_007894 [Nocardia transvalensis]|uniref:Uncharacterized protein n=1 Tax=Nocardia transvalensis TaxID=37333 RepID=A0A7W9UMT7_9NOCA|nr:RRQRL motif-containing zinc-binding protein [Nocardia transvalensis]MBB5918961.1 hypothetical protein [Nocardia transvalensis]